MSSHVAHNPSNDGSASGGSAVNARPSGNQMRRNPVDNEPANASVCHKTAGHDPIYINSAVALGSREPASRELICTNSADGNAAKNAHESLDPASHEPAGTNSANGGCCSTVEQVWLMKGGKRMGHADEQGWRISEVERLTGLSRRDIQRCCYEGKGGVGILQPANSSWGRRTYSKRDLATLFVVASYRRRGLTLPQVKEVFEKHEGEAGLTALLDDECEQASDQLEAILGRLLRAKALQASLEGDSSERLSQLFRNVATVHLVLFPGNDSLDELLAIPGMDLLVELWLGPGAAG